MFGSKPKNKEAETINEKPTEVKKGALQTLSVIAEGIKIGGELEGPGDVQLDGSFAGIIKCKALTIGKTGDLDGIVEADQVTVLGALKGEIYAKKVRLQHSAKVIGDVYHDVLEVAAGAKIEGKYSRKMPLDKEKNKENQKREAPLDEKNVDKSTDKNADKGDNTVKLEDMKKAKQVAE